MSLYSFYLMIHIIGAVIGAGAAFYSDGIFLLSSADKKISKDESKILRLGSRFVWFGLLIMALTGVGMFSLNPEAYLSSNSFITKITLVIIIVINGLIFAFIHHEEIKRRSSKQAKGKYENNFLPVSGVISSVSWASVLVLSLAKPQFSYLILLTVYTGVLSLGFISATVLIKKITYPKERVVLRLAALSALIFTIFFGILAYLGLSPQASVQIIERTLEGGVAFTLEEVALHNNAEDCWVIVGEEVFDVTEPGKEHPTPYPCGEDGTESFEMQHGDSRLRPYYVGDLK